MSARKHIVITGTGRAGTTFLVELLTHLGLDTGFRPDEMASKKNKEARAGLEYDIREKNCPFVVKSPFFCDYAEEVISRDDIVIQHVFVPIRDLHAAAESRRYVVTSSISKLPFAKYLTPILNPSKFDGGLVNTRSIDPGRQEEALLSQVYKLMLAMSDTTIPITFMRYPRIVKDGSYLFEKLTPILADVSFEFFCATFNKTVRPDLVHSFNQNDR